MVHLDAGDLGRGPRVRQRLAQSSEEIRIVQSFKAVLKTIGYYETRGAKVISAVLNSVAVSADMLLTVPPMINDHIWTCLLHYYHIWTCYSPSPQ